MGFKERGRKRRGWESLVKAAQFNGDLQPLPECHASAQAITMSSYLITFQISEACFVDKSEAQKKVQYLAQLPMIRRRLN